MKIPKVIHQVWLGSNEMPAEYVEFGESWRRHHPDWEFRLWTDDELPPLTCADGFQRCRNFGEASDVLRYDVLHQFGGVYVDTDVECLRPLESLIGEASAFAAYARPKLIGSAVVGAVPGHPAIKKTLEVVCAGAGTGRQVDATGPVALTKVLESAGDVELFGRETFYPLDYWEIPFSEAKPEDIGDAYAVHHWHATWQTKEELTRRTRALMLRLRERKERERERKKRDRRKLKRRERELESALARSERLRAKLDRIEGSRWWRLGQRLEGLTSAFRRRGAR